MKFSLFVFLSLAILHCDCNKGGNGGNSGNGGSAPPVSPPVTMGPSDVHAWLSTPDQAYLLKQLSTPMNFSASADSSGNVISVDSSRSFQSIDGFGYTLTGGSAYVIYSMPASSRAPLLRELFSNDSNAIGISYLRLSMGASDLNASVYSYDDVAQGQTDPTLAGFSLAQDTQYLVPLLKEILAINPNIKFIATPWSAPVWMKDNNSSTGGSLLPAYYGAYATYFVKYLLAMKAQGINIQSVTPQNEPLNPNNNPSLVMTAAQEATFIGSYLGPAFAAAGLSTKIVVYDHNCDHPEYATAVLGDATAGPYCDGAAFHLYAGTISALSTVHNAYPSKNVYFTEQYTASTGTFSGDFQWHINNVIIGSMNNWSRNALEWNLATNPSLGPYTPGGCNTCQGALTINGTSVSRNVSYYIVAQASKFVPSGSVRIVSGSVSGLANVAFLTPSGKKVLLVQNTGSSTMAFVIRFKGKNVPTSLNGGAAATYVW